MIDDVPMMDDVPIIESGFLIDDVPIIDEVPMIELGLLTNEVPMIDDVPMMDDVPIIESGFLIDDVPIIDEVPMIELGLLTNEVPMIDDVPMMDDVPMIESGFFADEVPMMDFVETLSANRRPPTTGWTPDASITCPISTFENLGSAIAGVKSTPNSSTLARPIDGSTEATVPFTNILVAPGTYEIARRLIDTAGSFTDPIIANMSPVCSMRSATV